MKLIIASLLLATTLQGQTPAAKFVDSARVEIDRAVVTKDTAQLSRAITLLDRALVAFPNDAYLLHYRGFAVYRQVIELVRGGKMASISPLLDRGISDLEKSGDKLAWPETFALLSALKAFRIAVDPSLGATIAMQLRTLQAKASQLGPSNPRVLLLQAYGAVNTPPEYGGGVEPARALVARAIKAFESDKPAPLAPAWGRDEAAELQKQLGISGG